MVALFLGVSGKMKQAPKKGVFVPWLVSCLVSWLVIFVQKKGLKTPPFALFEG
jgi:hypothetical protein